MQPVIDFLNNPLVAPLYALLVICVVNLLLAVYRSLQAHAFDWTKLPDVLDSMVLQKIVPLALLGVASYFVTDGTAQAGLTAAYVAGSVAALAGAVADFIPKVTGAYIPTTKAQDER